MGTKRYLAFLLVALLVLPLGAQENQLAFNADRGRAAAVPGGITCGTGGLIDEDFDGAVAVTGTGMSGTADNAWAGALTVMTGNADSTDIVATHFENDEFKLVNTIDNPNGDVTLDTGAAADGQVWYAASFYVSNVSATTANNARIPIMEATSDGGTFGAFDTGMEFRLTYQTATTDFTVGAYFGNTRASEFDGECGSTKSGIVTGRVYIVQLTASNAGATCGWELWDCGTDGSSCSSIHSQTGAVDPLVDFKDFGFGMHHASAHDNDPFTINFGFIKVDGTAAVCD